MYRYRADALQSAAEIGIAVRELLPDERASVLHDVAEKYVQGHVVDWAMWQSQFFAKHVSRQTEDGWKWCGDFVGQNEVVLFFNTSDDESMFAIPGGDALIRLLWEMHPMEFYLTKVSLSYLLCYNHHDFLIACGEAGEWLMNYKPSQ